MRASQRPYALRLRGPNPPKLKIINVVPECSYKDAVFPAGRDWAELWSDFNWVGWIKPQIDLAFANGANGIKIGCSGMPGNLNAYPSNAVLAARLRSVAAYVAGKGGVMYVSVGPSGSTYEWFNNDGSLNPTKVAGGKFVLSVLETIPNVVAVDLLNETNLSGIGNWSGGTSSTFVASMTAMFAAARAVSSLPMTCSIYMNSKADWTGSWMQGLAPFVDFQDGHAYYGIQGGTPASIPAASDVNALVAASWFKGGFLIGEVGAAQNATTSTQTSFINGLGSLISHPSCLGANLFSGADYDTTDGPGQQWGVSDAFVQNPRMAILTPFANTWPASLG